MAERILVMLWRNTCDLSTNRRVISNDDDDHKLNQVDDPRMQ